MKELKSFSECDGHIESILIGCRTVKVSFQTWNAKKLVIIYDDAESVKEQNSVFGDISEYTISKADDEFTQYTFFDADSNSVLSILARSVGIFEIGENADIDSALFDVGHEYIGGQKRRVK